MAAQPAGAGSGDHDGVPPWRSGQAGRCDRFFAKGKPDARKALIQNQATKQGRAKSTGLRLPA